MECDRILSLLLLLLEAEVRMGGSSRMVGERFESKWNPVNGLARLPNHSFCAQVQRAPKQQQEQRSKYSQDPMFWM